METSIKNKINEFNCDVKKLEATTKANKLALIYSVLTFLKNENVKFTISGDIINKYPINKSEVAFSSIRNAYIVKELKGLEDEIVFKIKTNENEDDVFYLDLSPDIEVLYGAEDAVRIRANDILYYNKR